MIDVNRKKMLYLGLAFIVMIIMMVLPLPDSVRDAGKGSLSREGQIAMGILLFSLILWMTEALPFHITCTTIRDLHDRVQER